MKNGIINTTSVHAETTPERPGRDVFQPQNRNSEILSIREYREIVDDHRSPDNQVRERLKYLEAFCRNIITNEINGYIKKIGEQSRSKSISRPAGPCIRSSLQ